MFTSRHLKKPDFERIKALILLIVDVMDLGLCENTRLYISTCGRMKKNVGLTCYNPRSSNMRWHFVTLAKWILDEEERFIKILIHELTHVKQFQSGKLWSGRKHVKWEGVLYKTPSGTNPLSESEKLTPEEYEALPWEIEARESEEKVYEYLITNRLLESVFPERKNNEQNTETSTGS